MRFRKEIWQRKSYEFPVLNDIINCLQGKQSNRSGYDETEKGGEKQRIKETAAGAVSEGKSLSETL